MKKLVKLFGLLTALCMIFACAACGNADKTLVVATNAEFEPFEYLKDGKVVGFDPDLITAIAEEMGYKVKFDNMEFDGVVAAVESGSCDIAISGLTINAKRMKSVAFCEPYYSGAAQILLVGKNDTHYTGTTKEELDEQLKNQAIGVCSGYTGQFYAQGDEEWGFTGIEGANVKIYENISIAIEDIKNGTINAIIMDDSVAKEAAEQNADAVRTIDIPLTIEEYGIAVAKGNDELINKINTAFAKLKDSGKVDELFKKYKLD